MKCLHIWYRTPKMLEIVSILKILKVYMYFVTIKITKGGNVAENSTKRILYRPVESLQL
eukprot:c36854_g1_i1 orf=3-176(-)